MSEQPGLFDGAQRIESVKSALIGAASGALASSPLALLVAHGSIAQWEYDVDTIGLSSALFAVVLRYTVRENQSVQLRQGAIAAFAIARAAGAVRVSDTCVPVPLRCGAAGLYLDASMLGQGLGALVVGAVAFSAVSAALDVAFSRGWVSPCPSRSD